MDSGMGRDTIPIYGNLQHQPANKHGMLPPLRYSGMAKKRKPPAGEHAQAFVIALQNTLADNLGVLARKQFGKDTKVSNLAVALEKEAKSQGFDVSKNTFLRMIEPNKQTPRVYARLDNVAIAARLFGVTAKDLLTPSFAASYAGAEVPAPTKSSPSGARSLGHRRSPAA
jgi:hypothetical protein